LQAGQAAPIQVEFSYECAEPSPAYSPSAILCWKGPGINRQPVAKAALAHPDGKTPGLEAEYRWSQSGAARVRAQDDASIDFAWPTPAMAVPRSPELVTQLSGHLAQLVEAPQYIDKCVSGQTAHAYLQDYASTSQLGSAQRRAFLQLLLDRPELLEKASGEQLLNVYRKLRFGAEEMALDVMGHWMQQRSNVTSEITADFFERNRRVYDELADCLGRQLPKELDALRDNYLANGDGGCVLPVAYTLSYGYLAADRSGISLSASAGKPAPSQFEEWIHYLTDKLADKSIAADNRINWLLARAQAEETRQSSGRLNLSAGRAWIDEASLTVEDEQAALRVAQERIARLVGMRLWPEAEAVVKSMPHAPAAWQAALNASKRSVDDELKQEADHAHRSLVREFERRREKAAKRDDKVAEARYLKRLKELGAPAK
jgi:hypothetical protein